MATCTISGTLKDISETAIEGAVVKARIVTPFFASSVLIVPKEVSTTSNSSGVWSLALSQNSSVIITIEYPPNTTDSRKIQNYAITVPGTSSASFSNLVTEV